MRLGELDDGAKPSHAACGRSMVCQYAEFVDDERPPVLRLPLQRGRELVRDHVALIGHRQRLLELEQRD